MARQFQPPTQIRQGPTKEEALLNPIAQTLQTLPQLWRQYKLQNIQQEIALKEAHSKYGTDTPAPVAPTPDVGYQPGESGYEDQVAQPMAPTAPMAPATPETPESELRRLGTEAYSRLHPQQYYSTGVGPDGKPIFTALPPGGKPGPAVPLPTTVLDAEGNPVTTTPGRTTVLPKSDEDKAKAKIETERPKATSSYNALLRQYDNMINEAKSIKEDPKLSGATGLLGGRMDASEGQRRISSNLDTLKAKTLINTLSSMKELSRNGSSGFGALSELEGENLKNSIASLNRKQGTKDFQNSLDKFILEIEAKKKDLTGTFTSTYGELPVTGATGGETTGLPQIGGTFQGGKVLKVRRIE